jgi:hypothetical protein
MYQWDGGAFAAALRSSPAAKMLEELSLAADQSASSSAIRTLKGLEQLKELELVITLLLGEAEAEAEGGRGDLADPSINDDFHLYPMTTNDGTIIVRLVDILPPTNRRLSLLMPSIAYEPGWKVKDCRVLSNGLASERDKLPNLKEVRLCAFWSEDSELALETGEQAMPRLLSDLIEQGPSAGFTFDYKQDPRPQLEHVYRCNIPWLL